jgi:hypothetical protein
LRYVLRWSAGNADHLFVSDLEDCPVVDGLADDNAPRCRFKLLNEAVIKNIAVEHQHHSG